MKVQITKQIQKIKRHQWINMKKGRFSNFKFFFGAVCNVVRISSDREDRKIFLGFKFSISGFF